MIAAEQCWQRAEQNRALAMSLAADAQTNWALVVAFYSALHYVNALHVYDGVYTNDMDHQDQRKLIKAKDGAILSDYNSLFGKGWRLARARLGR